MNFKLPIIPHDKANHFIYGLVAFAVAFPVVGEYIALVFVAILGGAKEVYDYQHRDVHTPSTADAIWTIAGGVLGCLIVLAAKLLH
jgi:hypothetical protein